MSIALDVGSHRFRSLRQDGSQLRGRSCRAAYAILPDTEAQRRLLEQAGVRYAQCEDSLVLIGDAAIDLAHLFQTRSLPLLPGGVLPENNPLARQITALLTETLLPEPNQPGEICCFTLPGNAAEESKHDNPELEFFSRLVKLRGYTPLVLNAGMAVVLAELARDAFTGISLCLGAAGSELVVAHRGLQVARCLIPRGGNWIDEQIAREFGDCGWDTHGKPYRDVDAAARRKLALSHALLDPANRDEEIVAGLYRDLMTHVVREGGRLLEPLSHLNRVSQPVNVVCTGGTLQPAGADRLVEQAFRSVRFPLEIAAIRSVEDWNFTAARGCLINAELETQTRNQQRAA